MRLAFSCALSIAAGSVLSCSTETGPPPPNVLLVVLDTTRADALSASGNDEAFTPNLDRLAVEGAWFGNARATSSWTLPTHASLFTGLFSFQHNAHNETDRLEESQVTVAELLAPTHETVGFSENPHIVPAKGFAQGFERFDETFQPAAGPEPATVEQFRDWFGNRDESRPFFAFVNLFTPHLPYAPPDRWLEHFFSEEERATGGPAELRRFADRDARLAMAGDLEITPEGRDLLRRLYLADVAWVDERLGAMLRPLRDGGVLDDTLLIVVGDHGENLGEHALWEHQFGLYEPVLRVPLLLRLPGVFEGGRQRSDPVQLTDVMPTLAQVAELDVESIAQLPGRSLVSEESAGDRPQISEYYLPVQQRPIFERTAPDFDFSAFDRRLRSIQIGDDKLIAWQDGQLELYDLASDPGELSDLSARRPHTARQLLDRLMAITGPWQPRPAGAAPELDAATREKLRSLGYL